MNKEIIIGPKNLRFMYYRYKDSPYYSLVIIFIVILICIWIFFNVILSHAQEWFSINNEIIATRRNIKILDGNTNIMNNLDKQLLSSRLQIASSALPPEKDFETIISAFSYAAMRSGVSLNDYSFQIGNIASTSGSQTNGIKKDISVINLSLSITGTINNAKQFLKEISEKFPLSEVNKFDFTNNLAMITIQFYQKPFIPIVFNPEEPIKDISDKQLQLINRIAKWQIGSTVKEASSPVSSPAAVPLF
jgi:hypothetical protein